MPSPTPTSLLSIEFKSPLVRLWTVCEILNLRPHEVLALIDEGSLKYAWNIASRASGYRDVRVLVKSIEDFQNGKAVNTTGMSLRKILASYGSPDQEREEFNSVVNLIFPTVSQRPGVVTTVSADTVMRRFAASHTHVLKLCREGSLNFAKGTVCRTGPGGSPKVTYSSVVEFLKKRRIT